MPVSESDRPPVAVTLDLNQAALLPVVRLAVRELMDALPVLPADGRIGYSEQEAAQLLGVPRHVLRDARLRGDLSAVKLGKGYCYSRAMLLKYLAGTK